MRPESRLETAPKMTSPLTNPMFIYGHFSITLSVSKYLWAVYILILSIKRFSQDPCASTSGVSFRSFQGDKKIFTHHVDYSSRQTTATTSFEHLRFSVKPRKQDQPKVQHTRNCL